MLDIKQLQENYQSMKSNLSARNIRIDLDRIISLYEDVKSQKRELEDMQGKLNALSKGPKNSASTAESPPSVAMSAMTLKLSLIHI